MVTLRRVISAIALAALVAMCVEPRLLKMPFIDRRPLEREMRDFTDRQWPQYPRFLEGVRARTLPGDTIALVVPDMIWDDGYCYAYYRASYFLTGREVLPLVDARNRQYPRNFRAARYVAAFGVTLRTPGEVLWHGDGGTLLRAGPGLSR